MKFGESIPLPLLGLALILLPAVLAGLQVARAEEPSGNAEVSAEGDFRLYCAECHGDDGRGDGPKSFGLSAPAPDLTKLRARNGGTFPREMLARVIDGREDIALHGGREMPVWGQWFKMEAAAELGGAEGDEDSIHRRVENLIDFIESLQD
ncbi:MAG: c-type cytochrome [Alphaproteobacteria bacterium]|nr:c-type cytochrome [Alphaproteobacteria bacterium]